MKKNPWIPLILVSILILVLTSIPKVPTPQKKIHFLDKIAHFVIYFLWGFTLTLVWKSRAKHSKKIIISTILLVLLFPAFDELHQYLIPARNPSFLDYFADFTGAASGFLIFRKYRKK